MATRAEDLNPGDAYQWSKGTAGTVLPKLGVTPSEEEIIQLYAAARGLRIKAVACTTALKVSKEQYPIPWIGRELIQNFTDHNPGDNKGTLNGVEFKEEQLSDGYSRFTITGHWPFYKYTGLESLHTDKPEGIENAGGNGFGVKQTAIRMMRDLDVRRFEVQGYNWDFNYGVLSAHEVNSFLLSQGLITEEQKLEFDWVIRTVEDVEPREDCHYIIETNNPELIEALRNMPELGVSDSNPRMEGLEVIRNGSGIKILPLSEEGEFQIGSLFMNGQIHRCANERDRTADFWGGLERVVLVLKDHKGVKISLDRPEVSAQEIGNHAKHLLNQLTSKELVELLESTKHLWGKTKNETWPEDRLACHAIINSILETLCYQRFDGETREELSAFTAGLIEGKYVLPDGFHAPSQSQSKKAHNEGFTLLPRYFSKLSLPKISEIFPDEVQPPDGSDLLRAHYEAAQGRGLEVGCNPFVQLRGQSAQVIGESLREAINEGIATLHISDDAPRRMGIVFAAEFPEKLLFTPNSNPNGVSQQLLFDIRGMIATLLREQIAQECTTQQAQVASAYSLVEDVEIDSTSLMMRNGAPSADSPSTKSFALNITFNEDNQHEVDRFIAGFETYPAQVRPERVQNHVAGMGYATFLEQRTFTSRKFGELVQEIVRNSGGTIRIEEEPSRSVVIELTRNVPGKLLDHPIPAPQDEDQKLLHMLRGVIVHTLRTGLAREAASYHPHATSSYTIEPDKEFGGTKLFISNSSAQGAEGGKLTTRLSLNQEHDAEDLYEFIAGLTEKPAPTHQSMEVGYSCFPGMPLNTPREFGETMRKLFDNSIESVTVSDEPSSDIKITFRRDIPPELIKHPVFSPRTQSQQYMHAVRGLIAHALDTKVATEAHTDHYSASMSYSLQQGESSLDGHRLYATYMESSSPELPSDGLVLTLRLDPTESRLAAEQFIAGFMQEKPIEAAQSLRERPRFGNQRGRTFLKFVAFAGLAVAFGPTAIRSIETFSRNLPLDALMSRYEKGAVGSKSLKWEDFTTMIRSMRNFRLPSLSDGLGDEDLVPSEPVENFEPLVPTQKQLARLQLLKDYVGLTTGIDVQNDLFIFRGDGAKGLNFGGRAIAIHENVIEVGFQENLETFIHEIGHNSGESEPTLDGHGNAWRHTYAALEAAIRERVNEIALKVRSGETLTKDEQEILDMPQRWEEIR